jgi:hypothetical protein
LLGAQSKGERRTGTRSRLLARLPNSSGPNPTAAILGLNERPRPIRTDSRTKSVI